MLSIFFRNRPINSYCFRPAIALSSFIALSLLLTLGSSVNAGVVVLNNRTTRPIELVIGTTESQRRLTLPAGSSRPLFDKTNPWVAYGPKGKQQREFLQLGSIYYFSKPDASSPDSSAKSNGYVLRRISLKGERLLKVPLVPQEAKASSIRLAIYVDEEELMTQIRWQKRLLKRVASVSKIIERHAGIKLEIVSFDYWRSDNKLTGLEPVLADFEKQVTPPPGVVAVGFSSQLELTKNRRQHLGGTRGPLRSHLLVREWAPQISEVERIEVLVHELGHYLGASHSAEQTSVMRPTLGAGVTRLKAEAIQFDPLNTMVIATVAQELRQREVRSFEQLSPANRALLSSVYGTLEQMLPKDPSAKRLHQRAQRNLPKKVLQTATEESLAGWVKHSLQEMTLEAAQNKRRALQATAASGLVTRAEKDELTNLLVRTMASSLAKLPGDDSTEKQKRKAFVYAIPLGVDRSFALKRFAFFKDLAEEADPTITRQLRLNVLGQPTARGRNDTLLHFAVSAALTAQEGPEAARFWGYAKEAFDAQPGGTGFSYADIAADEAGVRFAEALLSGRLPLSVLAERFDIQHFVPSLEGLPEGLPQEKYASEFGGLGDERHEAMLKQIQERIDQLPPYFQMTLKLP